jgi:uncharacterized membrane protein
MATMNAPSWLTRGTDALESADALDPAVGRLGPIAHKLATGPRGDALRGAWLGHALHPLMTDLPLGCWLASGLLDLVGGKRSRDASRRLIGLGLMFVPVTAASGLADWSGEEDDRVKRVGVAHAIGNGAVAALYLGSWRSRRAGRHAPAVLLGLAGGVLAWGTGYLGGHMSFARGAGAGERGLHAASASTTTASSPAQTDAAFSDGQSDLVDVSTAAAMLSVGEEQIRAMVAADLLVPVGAGTEVRFARADVIAARLVGG